MSAKLPKLFLNTKLYPFHPKPRGKYPFKRKAHAIAIKKGLKKTCKLSRNVPCHAGTSVYTKQVKKSHTECNKTKLRENTQNNLYYTPCADV